ncbi:MAG TPA: lysozyme inhibitor LprI family protein [Cyclobacteriaceae bacterium]|nr:lysozyme inhibitor LprI family protein [Cyclobacteriaceae bacterium]
MKRNYIEEIKQIKDRASLLSFHFFTLDKIERYVTYIDTIEKVKENKPPSVTEINRGFIKIIPISTVACFEGFFKSVCSELIDHGSPFTDNIKEFNKREIKFDFEIVSAIQSNKISMGEFASHILSFKNLENINSTLSVLLNSDFITLLKEFSKTSFYQDVNAKQLEFKQRQEEIFKSVKRTYEIRNIFCHEYSAGTEISVSEIVHLFKDCKLFMEQAKLVIGEAVFPDAPETQYEITQRAHEEYSKTDEELTILIEQLKKTEYYSDDDGTKALIEFIDAWKAYREKRASFDSLPTVGGAIHPTVRAGSLTQTTKELIESLTDQYKGILEKTN